MSASLVIRDYLMKSKIYFALRGCYLLINFQSKIGKIQFDKFAVLRKRKKQVLIVDDSKTVQKLLHKIISESKDFEVMAIAGDAFQAKTIIEKQTPDIITLDIHMPKMTGVEFLQSYLGEKSIPTVMISSVSTQEGSLILEALSSGASTYIQKPSMDNFKESAVEIIECLKNLSNNDTSETEPEPLSVLDQFESQDILICIGLSTGGTQALEVVLRSLPDKIPPIVIAQHIPKEFSAALAERLDSLCSFTVKEGINDEELKPNTVYIAPGGKHMKVIGRQRLRLLIIDEIRGKVHMPSVDIMFDSIPKLKNVPTLGIILTGMGNDGAEGLLKLSNMGVMIIAQDEKSSVVFGMPREAIALGAAKKIVSLRNMAKTIVQESKSLSKKEAA
jgi:two-component system chemotaxis response regulator CheB